MRRLFLYPTLIISGFFVVFSLATAQSLVTSRDAAGIRVFDNAEGLSAFDWYAAECAKGTFTKCSANPSPVLVDGYDGIRDGNTVYVGVANKKVDGTLETVIALISFTDVVNPKATEIFDQVLQNWKFNAKNVKGVKAKEALRRDVRRRAQLMSIRRALAAYHDIPRCSATQTRGCRLPCPAGETCDATRPQYCPTGATCTDCPVRETCGQFYPDLPSGSYVKGVSFSVWPSWQDNLGKVLGGSLPTDRGQPIKVMVPDPKDPQKKRETIVGQNFAGCGAPYDTKTCWDSRASKMSCPKSAYVYAYRFNKQNPPLVTTQYETDVLYAGDTGRFPQTWRGSDIHDPAKWGEGVDKFCERITASSDASSDFTTEGGDTIPDAFDNCPNTPNQDQRDSDKDGKGDVCDTCPYDDKNDGDEDGLCANADSCPTKKNLLNANGSQKDSDGDGVNDACDSQFCGNNIKEQGEACDGTGATSGVGAHERCTPQCTLQTLTYCGDGQVQTPNQDGGVQEQCDSPTARLIALCTSTAGYRGNKTATCVATSCQWGAFGECITTETCGDGTKNGNEQCDGTAGVGDHQRCQSNCVLQPLTHCGDGIKQTPNDEGGQEQCDPADRTKAGVGLHQECQSNCTLKNVTYCGDGVKQSTNGDGGTEQCDGVSGIGSHQSCTPQCTLQNTTWCGDGIKQTPNQEGVSEACDPRDPRRTGVGNRQICTETCTLETFNICGDGVKDGTEQCDMIGGTMDLGSPRPTCPSLGWGNEGQVGCDRNTCRYYGGGCSAGALSPGDVRIKIIWASGPADLDSYLIIPTQGKVGFGSLTGTVFSSPFAWYAWDDTTLPGLEIITVTKHEGAYYPGTYKMYVYNYTGNTSIPPSPSSFVGTGARVEVYTYDASSSQNARLAMNSTIPSSGTGAYWYVFDFNNGIFTGKNLIQASAPSP